MPFVCYSLTRQPSKRVTGEPFIVKEVVAVDMFPHTEHSELVMLLERNSCSRNWCFDILKMTVHAIMPTEMKSFCAVDVTLIFHHNNIMTLYRAYISTTVNEDIALYLWTCFLPLHKSMAVVSGLKTSVVDTGLHSAALLLTSVAIFCRQYSVNHVFIVTVTRICRRKGGHGPGLGKLPKIWGSPSYLHNGWS